MGTNTDNTLFTPEQVAQQLIELAHIDGELSDSEKNFIDNFCDQYQLDYKSILRYYESLGKLIWREVEIIGVNRAKGLDFEKTIVKTMIKNSKNLLEWRGDKITDNIQAQSNFNPDLRIRYGIGKGQIIYNVECKWRAEFTIEKNKRWIYIENQNITRYKDYAAEKGEKVFLALGIGNRPDNPEHIYFIEIDEIEKMDNTQYVLHQFDSKSVHLPCVKFELRKIFKFTLDQLSKPYFIERFYKSKS